MNIKLLIAVLVVVVVGGGAWYYLYGVPGMQTSQGADMRFGDDGEEGGSVKPDTRLVVGESIMGKWQSTEDAAFAREFTDFDETSLTGTVIDYYNNEEVTRGTYSVAMNGDFTEIDITEQGSQQETLHFKLVEATPESLKMVYLDRGGELDFTAVK